MSRPTPAQVAAIDYFASVVDRERPRVDTNRNFSQTTKACEDRGWIERIEDFPYHAPTDAGRAVLAAARVETPEESAKIVDQNLKAMGSAGLASGGAR